MHNKNIWIVRCVPFVIIKLTPSIMWPPKIPIIGNLVILWQGSINIAKLQNSLTLIFAIFYMKQVLSENFLVLNVIKFCVQNMHKYTKQKLNLTSFSDIASNSAASELLCAWFISKVLPSSRPLFSIWACSSSLFSWRPANVRKLGGRKKCETVSDEKWASKIAQKLWTVFY